MITVNLQWLSLPFFGYAVYSLICGIAGFLTAPSADIGPLIGWALLAKGFETCALNGMIGALIVAAFRLNKPQPKDS